MKKPFLIALSVFVSSALIVSYLALARDRCPESNSVAVEQYQSNKPSLSRQSIVDTDQKAIADRLVALWLDRFTASNADPGIRLEQYQTDSVQVGEWKGDRFVARVAFSVRPVKCSYDEWLTGNGEEAGDWIRRKLLFFNIAKEDTAYRVVEVGSSP